MVMGTGQTGEPTIEPGDILFYSSSGSLFDRLIDFFTHPVLHIVHVAISQTPRLQIEAESPYIISDVIREPVAIVSLRKLSKDYDETAIHEAMLWLDSMVGKPYGWSDIATAIKAIFAALVPFYVVEPGHYDCSALATEFLAKCGGVDLGGLDLDPHTVTPALLAKQLGVGKA